MSDELKLKINNLTNKLINGKSFSNFENDSQMTISSLLQECIEDDSIDPVHSEIVNHINDAILNAFSKNTTIENGMSAISSQLNFENDSLVNMKGYINAIIDARSFAFDHPNEMNPHINDAIKHGDAVAAAIGAGIIQKAKAYAGYGKSKLRASRNKASDTSSLSSTSNLNGEYKFQTGLDLFTVNPEDSAPSFSRNMPRDLGTLYARSGLNKGPSSSSRPFTFKEPLNIHFDFSNANGSNSWKTIQTYKGDGVHVFELQTSFGQKMKGFNTIDFSRYPQQTVDFNLTAELNFEGSPDRSVPYTSLEKFDLNGKIDYRQIKMGISQKLSKMVVKSFFTDFVYEKESSRKYYIGVQIVLERFDKINPYLFWISKIVVTGTQSNESGFLAAEYSDFPKLAGTMIESIVRLPIYTLKFVEDSNRYIGRFISKERIVSPDQVQQHVSLLEKEAILSFRYKHGDDAYFITTGSSYFTDLSSTQIVKDRSDKSLIHMMWRNEDVYKNMSSNYAVNLSQIPDNPLTFDFTFSYYPEKNPNYRAGSHGSFFKNLTFNCVFDGLPPDVFSGWLATIIEFKNDEILSKKYKYGLLLLINIVPIHESTSHVKVNSIVVSHISSDSRRRLILSMILDSPQTEPISGLFSSFYKKVRGKSTDRKSNTIEPIVPEISGSPMTTHDNDLSSLDGTDSTEHQPSSMFETSRLTTWSDNPSGRAPLVLVDPYSSSFREILTVVRTAQTDAYIKDSAFGVPAFIPPKSVNYIKLINGGLVSARSLQYKNPNLPYDLSGIENANPDAVYEIDFTATDPAEQYQIMQHWVWYESNNGQYLVIIPRPPFDLSMWAFEFNARLKIDAELAIDGISYSLRSKFNQTNLGGEQQRRILRFAPIKNKVINLVLDNEKLKQIVIYRDDNVIVPIVPPLTPLPSLSSSSSSSSTSEPSTSRGWRLRRAKSPTRDDVGVVKQTLAITDPIIRMVNVYNATDPSFDSYLKKFSLLKSGKIRTSAIPVKWIKSLSFTDKKPEIVDGYPTNTHFSIEFPSSKDLQTNNRNWQWVQESTSDNDSNRIIAVPGERYFPTISFEKLKNGIEFDPHTWSIVVVYPNSPKRLETHVFTLPSEYANRVDIVIGTVIQNNIHLFVYLHPLPGKSQESISYAINGIILENTNVARPLPPIHLFSPSAIPSTPVNVYTSPNGNKFNPSHVAKVTKAAPGMLRLPSSRQLTQKPPATMIPNTPSLPSSQSTTSLQPEDATKKNERQPIVPLELPEESSLSFTESEEPLESSSSSSSETPSTPIYEMPMFHSSTSSLSSLDPTLSSRPPSPSLSSSSTSSSGKTSQVVTEIPEIEKQIEDIIGDDIHFNSDFEIDSDSLESFL